MDQIWRVLTPSSVCAGTASFCRPRCSLSPLNIFNTQTLDSSVIQVSASLLFSLFFFVPALNVLHTKEYLHTVPDPTCLVSPFWGGMWMRDLAGWLPSCRTGVCARACVCVCARAPTSAPLGAPAMTHVVTRGMLGAGKGWLEEGGEMQLTR